MMIVDYSITQRKILNGLLKKVERQLGGSIENPQFQSRLLLLMYAAYSQPCEIWNKEKQWSPAATMEGEVTPVTRRIHEA